MDTLVTTSPQSPSQRLALVTFSMFVYVADLEKDITTQEIRRFQTLIRDTSWSTNPDLLEALAVLRDTYTSLWAAYADGQLLVSPELIQENLLSVRGVLGGERDLQLRKDISKFLDRLERGILGVKLAQGDQKSKALARKTLREIIRPVSTCNTTNPRNTDIEIGKDILHGVDTTSPMRTTSVPVWQSGKTRVKCVSVVQETHDTKTYSFSAEPQILFHFKPGQFVTIEVDLLDQVLRRSYTISSSPSRPYLLSITVKRVPMGWMSNWLYDNMVEGAECSISGPAGKFTCADHMAPRMLFLAAGSGITPCMSMLRWLADTPSTTDIVFINIVRTPADIIFHQELLYISSRLGSRLRLAIVPGDVPPGQPWNGQVGRLTAELIKCYAPDYLTREVFSCGPSGFMDYAKELLKSLDFPLERYHQESFGPGSAKKGPPLPPASLLTRQDIIQSELLMPSSVSQKPEPITAVVSAPASEQSSKASVVGASKPQTAKISIAGSNNPFISNAGETILEAAEANGVTLQHSCRSGLCGACKMQKVSGMVELDEGHCLSPDDVESGLILTCVGRARSDLSLTN